MSKLFVEQTYRVALNHSSAPWIRSSIAVSIITLSLRITLRFYSNFSPSNIHVPFPCNNLEIKMPEKAAVNQTSLRGCSFQSAAPALSLSDAVCQILTSGPMNFFIFHIDNPLPPYCTFISFFYFYAESHLSPAIAHVKQPPSLKRHVSKHRTTSVNDCYAHRFRMQPLTLLQSTCRHDDDAKGCKA